jgi:ATP-binding cassette subfamily B protein
VLVRLLRLHLQPYGQALAAVVALQLVGTMASLYLPSLNADIIDNGIARGDTGYIMSTGGWMLAVTLLQVACSIAAVYFGARPWASDATSGPRSSTAWAFPRASSTASAPRR